jgi:hypothetical protein
MRYRTPQEILSTTPEERVYEVFVDLFGPIGLQIATEFATLPEYKERYKTMLAAEKEHQDKMRKLLNEQKKFHR